MGEKISNPPTNETGFIRVTSEPAGATVFINGVERGTTLTMREKPWLALRAPLWVTSMK